MIHLVRLGLLLLVSVLAVEARVSLPSFVSRGMVLQRDRPIPLWGWADPGEKITVSLNGATASSHAGPDRKWQLALPAQKAGGPFQMIVAGKNRIVLDDILVGEVWLCGGQSNMAANLGRPNIRAHYASEIATANHPRIRQFLVKEKVGFTSVDDVESTAGWESVDPKTVLHFSAVAYFFAKELEQKYQVPVGLIVSSVGGTPAQAWMSRDALREFPAYHAVASRYENPQEVELTRALHRAKTEQWSASIKQGDKGLAGSWQGDTPDSDLAEWKSVARPTPWKDEISPTFYGVIWYRKDLALPAALAGKPASVALGAMQTRDTVYFNGVEIGQTESRYASRVYPIPANAVRAGKNTIAVRLLNQFGGGGFEAGSALRFRCDGTEIDLTGGWRHRIGIARPTLAGGNGLSGHTPSAYYYSMLQPLAGYGIKGVLWYQGEGNTGNPAEYRTLFPALIKLWRDDWAAPELPFLFVQLANYCRTPEEPAVSNWALLREAQSLALALPATGMAVTHDIGERNEIHPRNKAEVGRRLALVARQVAYGDERVVASGPQFHAMEITKNVASLSFTHAGAGLSVRGDRLQHFTIAGADQIFIPAHAEISGDRVRVWSDQIPRPVAVRYAWADSPDGANLYNRDGLPASSFRTDRD